MIRLQPEEEISLLADEQDAQPEGVELRPVDLNLSLTDAFMNRPRAGGSPMSG